MMAAIARVEQKVDVMNDAIARVEQKVDGLRGELDIAKDMLSLVEQPGSASSQPASGRPGIAAQAIQHMMAILKGKHGMQRWEQIDNKADDEKADDEKADDKGDENMNGSLRGLW